MTYEEIINLKKSDRITVNKDIYPSLLKGQICKFNGLKDEKNAFLVSTITGNTYIVKFKNVVKMTKLELLKAEQMELTNNIGWTESNLDGITEEEKELYIYELNELEVVSRQIAQVTEWEQLGYHENKIVELFKEMYPVVEIIESATYTLGNNGSKKEITLFTDARILIEKYDNNGKLMWQLFKGATTSNLEWLLKQGFSNKIYDVRMR